MTNENEKARTATESTINHMMSFRDFVESGLLFEINRLFLWPRGMALGAVLEDDGSEEGKDKPVGLRAFDYGEIITDDTDAGLTGDRSMAFSKWDREHLQRLERLIGERAKAE